MNATYLGGTFTQATWKATLTINPGFSALQAIATVPWLAGGSPSRMFPAFAPIFTLDTRRAPTDIFAP